MPKFLLTSYLQKTQYCPETALEAKNTPKYGRNSAFHNCLSANPLATSPIQLADSIATRPHDIGWVGN